MSEPRSIVVRAATTCWAVLAEDPQEDEAGIYLEYIERDTGEAGGISVAATEMLPTRHIEHEEN